jgi:hypothetical protein
MIYELFSSYEILQNQSYIILKIPKILIQTINYSTVTDFAKLRG